MNTDKAYAEKIASEYAPQETRKAVTLKKLDNRAKAPARIFAYTFGVIQQKPVNMTLIPAIAMAAYTTYKITMAAVNLKRRRKSADNLTRMLRTISFIDALVSILTLQNTLIMVSAKGNLSEILPLTAITSGVIWAFILLLSVSALLNGIPNIKRK